MCDLPSFGSVDAGCVFMFDVRLRDEGSQFGDVNGRSTDAKHTMSKGAKSTEEMQRRSRETVGTGKDEDA